MGKRRPLDPRNSGVVPGNAKACLHNYPDYRVQDGSEGRRAARKEGRQLPHFRRDDLSRFCPAKAHRRSAGDVRRTLAVRNGAPDRFGQAVSSSTNAPPPLSAAIQEQIGIKLDPTRASVEILVIDHVEKPANKD